MAGRNWCSGKRKQSFDRRPSRGICQIDPAWPGSMAGPEPPYSFGQGHVGPERPARRQRTTTDYKWTLGITLSKLNKRHGNMEVRMNEQDLAVEARMEAIAIAYCEL